MVAVLGTVFRAVLIIIGLHFVIQALKKNKEKNQMHDLVARMNQVSGSPLSPPLSLSLQSQLEEEMVKDRLGSEIRNSMERNIINDLVADGVLNAGELGHMNNIVNGDLDGSMSDRRAGDITQSDIRLEMEKHFDHDRSMSMVSDQVYAGNDCNDQFSRAEFRDEKRTPFARNIGMRADDYNIRNGGDKYFKKINYKPKMNMSQNMNANKPQLAKRNPLIDSTRYNNCPESKMKSGQCNFQNYDPFTENFASY